MFLCFSGTYILLFEKSRAGWPVHLKIQLVLPKGEFDHTGAQNFQIL